MAALHAFSFFPQFRVQVVLLSISCLLHQAEFPCFPFHPHCFSAFLRSSSIPFQFKFLSASTLPFTFPNSAFSTIPSSPSPLSSFPLLLPISSFLFLIFPPLLSPFSSSPPLTIGLFQSLSSSSSSSFSSLLLSLNFIFLAFLLSTFSSFSAKSAVHYPPPKIAEILLLIPQHFY